MAAQGKRKDPRMDLHHDDGRAELHRIYVPSLGNKKKIIGWVSPTTNGWIGHAFHEEFKLSALANGFIPRKVRIAEHLAKSSAIAAVRREWVRLRNLKEINRSRN